MAKGKFSKLDVKPTTFPPLPHNYKALKPLRDFVHVQLDRSPDVIDMGLGRDPIVLSGSSKATCEHCQAKVLALGPEAKDIKVGETVLIHQHHGSDNDGRVRKDGTMLIQRKHVLCVVEA